MALIEITELDSETDISSNDKLYTELSKLF